VEVVASIEDPVVVKKILDHLQKTAITKDPNPLPYNWTRRLVGLQAGLFGGCPTTTVQRSWLSWEARQGFGLPDGQNAAAADEKAGGFSAIVV
jgi:hypothetical protein